MGTPAAWAVPACADPRRPGTGLASISKCRRRGPCPRRQAGDRETPGPPTRVLGGALRRQGRTRRRHWGLGPSVAQARCAGRWQVVGMLWSVCRHLAVSSLPSPCSPGHCTAPAQALGPAGGPLPAVGIRLRGVTFILVFEVLPPAPRWAPLSSTVSGAAARSASGREAGSWSRRCRQMHPLTGGVLPGAGRNKSPRVAGGWGPAGGTGPEVPGQRAER